MVVPAAEGASARTGLTAAGRWEPSTGWVQQPPMRQRVGDIVRGIETHVRKTRRSPPGYARADLAFAHRSHPPVHFRSGAAPTGRAINLTTTRQGLHAILLCLSARVDARHGCSVDTANAAVPKSFLLQCAASETPLRRKTATTRCQKAISQFKMLSSRRRAGFLDSPFHPPKNGSWCQNEPGTAAKLQERH